MHISAFKQSKFLTRSDVGRGVLATVKDFFQENVAKEGAPEEYKWCMSFVELEKPLVVNNTNAQIMSTVFGSEETDNWIGKQIVLYDDPNVSFGGKLVGGIRCRAPKPAAGVPASAVVGTHGMLGKPASRPAPAQVAAAVAQELKETAPLPTDEDVPF